MDAAVAKPKGNPNFRRVNALDKNSKTIHEQNTAEFKALNPEAKTPPPPQDLPSENLGRTWDEIEKVESEEDALELVGLCQIPEDQKTVFVSEDKKVMYFSHFGWLRDYCTQNKLKLFEVTCH